MRRTPALLLSLFLLVGCAAPFDIRPGDLDDGTRAPQSNLVSASLSDEAKQKPVVVAAHGYGATPYETSLVAEALRNRGIPVSEVALGGHGSHIREFAKTTWKTWEAPVIAEYQRLKAAGFQKVGILATSTGGALVIEAISRKAIDPVDRLVMVAPIVGFADGRAAYLMPLSYLGVSANIDPKGGSLGRWYRNRPASSVASLIDLTEIVRARLAKGIQFPETAKTLIIQSTRDKTVHPSSASIIRSGLHGGVVQVDMVDSGRHIPVWPDGASDQPWTDAEKALRETLMQQIADHFASW
ncbi:MAG: alpha/beta hydrolase [Bacteroidota bacterium]